MIKVERIRDFGEELSVKVLRLGGFYLLEVYISWSDFPSWPYLQVSLGHGKFFNFFTYFYKFGLEFTVLGRAWDPVPEFPDPPEIPGEEALTAAPDQPKL